MTKILKNHEIEKAVESNLDQLSSKNGSRIFLIRDSLPSLIAFVNRLFCDGNYNFESNNEPPFFNRNWFAHGKMCRRVRRFECVQLFNAVNTLVEIEKVICKETGVND